MVAVDEREREREREKKRVPCDIQRGCNFCRNIRSPKSMRFLLNLKTAISFFLFLSYSEIFGQVDDRLGGQFRSCANWLFWFEFNGERERKKRVFLSDEKYRFLVHSVF